MADSKGSVAGGTPPINYLHELTYLLELADLGAMMGLHAERLRQAAAEWQGHDMAARIGVEISRRRPGATDMDALLGAIQEKTKRQGHAFVAIDGFLSAWARASLFLWPAPSRYRTDDQKAASRARGVYLREVLEIKDDHALNNRGLRNDWAHYDERLDDALATHGRVTGQRFSPPQHGAGSLTMRTIDLVNMRVVFAGQNEYDLKLLFAAAADLERRVAAATHSLAARRHEEILAQADANSY